MSISLLRRLLMKEAVKDTAGSSGIMSINKKIADKVEQQVQRYVNDAMQQGVDLDTLSPEQLKMIVQINKPKPPRVIAADSPEGRQITEQLFGKRGEVVDMAGKKLDTSQGIMGGKSVKELMDSGQVTKGARGMKKSKKVQDREMFKAANKRLTSDVDSIIKNIKSMEPITAMKEASSVIGRKGKYKNLTEEQSKKILQDTEDHIFQRDPDNLYDPDPEDFASGGRAGFAGGSDMGTVADSKGKTGPSKGGYQGGGTGPVERPSGGGGGGNNNNTTYDYTIPKQIVKQTAINTAKNLGRRELMNTLGLAKFSNPIGIAMALKNFYDQTQNPTLTEEEATGGGITGLATGGIARANFVGGGMGRRGFLKLLGLTGAGIAGAKTGLMSLAKKSEPVVEAVKETAQEVPSYFFSLVNKIRSLGDDTLATQDKTIAKKYKDYVMEEDFAGNIEIIKKGDDVAEDVFMSYKVDEVPLKKGGSRKVEEYEEYTARPDMEGKMKDVEPGVPNSVVEEAMSEAPSIKKASGGIARMLGE
jgi:hypothetical protein